MTTETHGLLLDLGGAPSCPMTVHGIGTFTRDIPVPLADLNLSLKDAEAFSKDPGCPLTLVKLATPKKVTADEAKEN